MKKVLALIFGLFLAGVVWAGLETGTYISDLVVTNPTGSDHYSTADDHIRLLKSTIKNTFPNIDGAMTLTDEQLNTDLGRLSLSNLFSDTGSATTTLSVQDPVAQFSLRETGATANEGNWLLRADGDVLCVHTANDAAPTSAVASPICVSGRTGTTVDSLTLTATSTTLSGAATTTGQHNLTRNRTASGEHAALLSAANISLGFAETGVAADNARWSISVNNEHFELYVLNDTEASGTAWLTTERTGTTVDSINLQAAAVQANGSLIWNAGNDGAGSGLDADLLDGQTANFFQNASNITSGTLPDARIASSGVTQHMDDGYARNITGKAGVTKTLSTSNPSGGSDGDIWYQY